MDNKNKIYDDESFAGLMFIVTLGVLIIAYILSPTQSTTQLDHVVATDLRQRMTTQEIDDASEFDPSDPNGVMCYERAQVHEDMGKNWRYKKDSARFKKEADSMRCKCQDQEIAFDKMVSQ